jgi:SsrA-binding protein
MSITINNKKARHDYHILETIETGIELKGSEVKSIRQGKVNLKDSFAKISKREVILMKTHISPYENSSIFNHDPERPRKLLLHKREILKLENKIKQSGLTLVPIKLYINSRGKVKVELALAQGKKSYDKRESLAKRDFERKIQKNTKYEHF